MEVRAIATGYYGHRVRVPGTDSASFSIEARADFSKVWMEPVGWNPEADPLDHDGDGEKGGMAGLAGMTVVKLRELAKERNVDLAGITAKADIVAALELAAEASTDTTTDDEKIAKAKEISGRDDLTVEQADEILAAAAASDI